MNSNNISKLEVKFAEKRLACSNKYVYDVKQIEFATESDWSSCYNDNTSHLTYYSYVLFDDKIYEVREDFINRSYQVEARLHARYVKSVDKFKSYKCQQLVRDEKLTEEILKLDRYYRRDLK